MKEYFWKIFRCFWLNQNYKLTVRLHMNNAAVVDKKGDLRVFAPGGLHCKIGIHPQTDYIMYRCRILFKQVL